MVSLNRWAGSWAAGNWAAGNWEAGSREAGSWGELMRRVVIGQPVAGREVDAAGREGGCGRAGRLERYVECEIREPLCGGGKESFHNSGRVFQTHTQLFLYFQ